MLRQHAQLAHCLKSNVTEKAGGVPALPRLFAEQRRRPLSQQQLLVQALTVDDREKAAGAIRDATIL